MPRLGLGTWQNDDPRRCADSVETALELGYRHVDTAQVYDNEEAVGEGIAAAGVDREEVFLASKLWVSNLDAESVRTTAEESLARLGVDSLDLLYVHWPARSYDPEETLSALAELRAEGAIDRIGVSNFEPEHLDRAREVLGEYPFAVQVEMHPFLPQRELRDYVDGTDVELVAYSPLARGKVVGHPALEAVADSYDASAAQVALAWVRQKGATAIPKATGRDHLVDNFRSLDLTLDAEDVAAIDAIDEVERLVHPDFAPATW